MLNTTKMKPYILLLTLAILTIVTPIVQSQTPHKLGLEIGFAFSKFPYNKSYIRHEGYIDKYICYRTETSVPLYSPLLGLTSNLKIKKNFQYTFGIQYQKTGNRNHIREYVDDINRGTYKWDEWENQTFHKLCLPVSFGFTTKIWKLQPSIFIGLRPNIFLKGKYFNRSVSIEFSPLQDTVMYVYEFNPVDARKLERPVRFDMQAFCGFSTLIGEKIRLSVTLNYGSDICYSISANSCTPYSFHNKDYAFSISYLIPVTNKKSGKYDKK
jgi:hypothetical protein